MRNTIAFGNCQEILPTWVERGLCVQTCITSPPYFGLRDYGQEGQIGQEQTPQEYVQNLVEVFRHVRSLLSDDGTLWLNLGDSYGDKKNLLGIPWRVALALQDDGWILRQDIIWHKPNAMPESVRDRCTKAHEYLFLFTKNGQYFYDNEAIKEQAVGQSFGQAGSFKREASKRANVPGQAIGTHRADREHIEYSGALRNRRSVWSVATRAYEGAHFAVFPPELIEPCVLAATSEVGHCPQCLARVERVVHRKPMKVRKTARNIERGTRTGTSGTMIAPPESTTVGWQATCGCAMRPQPDVVLDPFMGSGTTAMVAAQNGRDYLGCELNLEYERLQQERLAMINGRLF